MISRLIKNEKDYDAALSRIEQLMDAKSGTAEMDELELLTALVEMYEERHFPISPPDPVDAIKFRMEQLGLAQKDMVPYIGTKGKVSEVLNGKRPLTLAMMRSLNKSLDISHFEDKFHGWFFILQKNSAISGDFSTDGLAR